MKSKQLFMGILLVNATIINGRGRESRSDIELSDIELVSRFVNLERIVLMKRDLSKLDLQNAKLKEAMILNSNLSQTDLRGAQLQGADFFGSILIGTKFEDANLRDAKSLDKAIYKKCRTFPFNWLLRWEYDKDNLSLSQIAEILTAGYTVCQTTYNDHEISILEKFHDHYKKGN